MIIRKEYRSISTEVHTKVKWVSPRRSTTVLVSITLDENISAGQRLVRKIKDEFTIPILIGGYALQSEKIPKFEGEIIGDVGLEEVPKIIRKSKP